jgi:hypothetical protein
MLFKREELTTEQYTAILMIASGKSNASVAKECGVSTRTVERWRVLPTFKTLVKEAILDIYDAAIAELILGAKEATRQLIQIIEDEETPRKTKVVAINSLLNQAAKYKSVLLEERLEKLESSLDDNLIQD